MQPDLEAGCGLCQLDRPAPRLSADHQAGIGQNTVLMGVEDCRVDLVGQAKVVAVDDEAFSSESDHGFQK